MFQTKPTEFLLISDSNIVGQKLEKYLKRHLGTKWKTLNFSHFLNSFEKALKYIDFIGPKVIIINLFLVNEFKKLNINIPNHLKIAIIKHNDLEEFKVKTYKKRLIYFNLPSFIGFDENKNEIIDFKESKFLIDELCDCIIAYLVYQNPLPKIFYNKFQNLKIAQKQEKCSLRLIYKMDPNDICFNKNIGEFRINLGILLAKQLDKKLIQNIDYIVPVPSSGNFYAVGLSKMTKIPILPALKKIQVSERAFEIQNVDARKKYLYENMQINFHLIKNKSIILVDEAIFTGATLKVICDILQDNGIKEIHLAIPSPKCFSQCEYLVFPKRTLLLNKINENYITKYFGVKSCIFLPLNRYKTALKQVNNELCYECFEIKNKDI